MPIVKYIAVHSSPLKFLRYVTKETKTEKTLVTGLNCSSDPKILYDDLKYQFETLRGERFYKKSIDEKTAEKEKETVRIHHYIQSFKPGEVTPEEAHKIGLEWAREVFGNNHSVLVSTHIDRGHIHNHFAVAAYDLAGKRWYGNKATLTRCRNISDKIAKAHGLSVIEKPKYRPNHKYGEHKARQGGYSWKQKLCDELDRLVVNPNVHSIDDLVRELKANGYEITKGKYLSIKARRHRRAIRSYRLGDGYSLEHLEYRLIHKNLEMPLSEVLRYEGIQREWAMCIRQIQIEIYRKPENDRLHLATYREVLKSTELLNYIVGHKIKSEGDFKNLVSAEDEKLNLLFEEKKKILDSISDEEQHIKDLKKYLEIKSKKVLLVSDIEELKKYRYLKKAGIANAEDFEIFETKISELREQLEALDVKIENAKSDKKALSDKFQLLDKSIKSDYQVFLERAKAEIENQRMAEEREKEILREKEISENADRHISDANISI